MSRAMSRVARISTDRAPAPAGHYSQAIKHDGLIYVSGQLPVQSRGAHDTEAAFDDQVRLAMTNLLAILHAAGSAPRGLIKVTAYIVGIENWPRFNAVYAEILGDIKPARSIVPVPELHYGYLVEIDALAAEVCDNQTQ
jgi:2-iminobutanoate/2-iminopropanoate deaminase